MFFLSYIFGGNNTSSRLIGGLVVLSLISLIIYGIYYLIKYYSNESFTNPTDLTPGDNEVVVALFYADWCGHCKHFKPEFDKVQTELNGKSGKSGKKLKIVKVDCTSNSDLSNKYNVRGFPTVKIFGSSNGESEYNGSRESEELKSYILAL